MVDIGTTDRTSNARLDIVQFDNNDSFMSVDMLAIASERPSLMKRLLSDVSKLLKRGKIRSVSPISSFSISDAGTALKKLQIGRSYGKLVVVTRDDDVVMVSLLLHCGQLD